MCGSEIVNTFFFQKHGLDTALSRVFDHPTVRQTLPLRMFCERLSASCPNLSELLRHMGFASVHQWLACTGLAFGLHLSKDNYGIANRAPKQWVVRRARQL